MTNKKPSKKKYPEPEDFSKIEARIKELFSTQEKSNISEALLLCSTYGINHQQFDLYHLPEEESEYPELNQLNNKFVKKTTPKTNTQKKPEPKIKKEIFFHEEFPFSSKEIYTLSKQSLVNIINGCISSYGSQDIIKVFNTREYLGKMGGITNLKKQPDYLNRIYNELLTKEKSIDFAFDELIKYLDVQAYQQNKWILQTKEFRKDVFSTAKNAQKERITRIPEIEKAKFIDSILFKPIDLVRNHNYIHNKEPFQELLNDTKTGYVKFLIKQLYTKWNNKDTV